MANGSLATAHQSYDIPQVRRIGLPDLQMALRQGWDDFLAIPTQLVFLGILYPIIGIVAARAAEGGGLLPLLFPLVAGLALVGPVLAIGLYEISRRREAGQPTSWRNAFDVLRSPALPGIIVLGVLLFVIFGVWIGCARAIYVGTIGAASASMAVPDTLGALVDVVMHAPGHGSLIVLGNLAGFLFAVLVLTISVVSFPMLLDRNCPPMVAVQTSVRAVWLNPVPMAAWGLMVAVLLALGSVPFFVGLAVAMPVLGHATWHLYRRVVV